MSYPDLGGTLGRPYNPAHGAPPIPRPEGNPPGPPARPPESGSGWEMGALAPLADIPDPSGTTPPAGEPRPSSGPFPQRTYPVTTDITLDLAAIDGRLDALESPPASA